MTTPLRVGLWGVGSHARKNLVPALIECPDTQLTATLSRSGQALPDVDATNDPEAFLSMDLDVVLVAGPPGLHPEHASRALDADHHVWLEKPAATSLAETESLVRQADGRGRVVLETDMFLHHPQWAMLRSLVDQIGGVDSMTARFGFPHLPPNNIRYRADLGGGALNDTGFYPIAAAENLLGRDIRVAGAHLVRAGHEVDTAGGALLIDGDGRRAHLEWGFGRGYRSEVEVWGTDGWLRAERAFAKPADLPTEVTIRAGGGPADAESIAPANHFVAMYTAFAEATRSVNRLGSERMIRRARVMERIRQA